MPPSASGTQPPSKTFSRFAARKVRSSNRKGAISAAAATADHLQTFQITTNPIIAVTTIVPVTEMPYADASALDERNSSTSSMTAMNSNRLTRGM